MPTPSPRLSPGELHTNYSVLWLAFNEVVAVSRDFQKDPLNWVWHPSEADDLVETRKLLEESHTRLSQGAVQALAQLHRAGEPIPDSWITATPRVTLETVQDGKGLLHLVCHRHDSEEKLFDILNALKVRIFRLEQSAPESTDSDLREDEQKEPPRPEWNTDTGELRFQGAVAKKIKNLKSAVNVTKVLAAFQEEGWPVRVDDPTEPTSSIHKTVESLNNNLSGIRFSADGTGEGFRWEKI